MRDDEVPGWWRGLGLSGLVDVHVHFLPDPVMNAVWDYFDQAERHYGVAWPIHTARRSRTGWPRWQPWACGRSLRWYTHTSRAWPPGCRSGPGVRRPHPGCVPSGTFYPEPDVAAYVDAALEAGTRIFKVHLQVGGYDPRTEELDPVWGRLAEAGVPVVVHCGSGPIPGRHTGPGPFGEVLRRHPTLTAVIAHLGMPEYAEHLALAERYPDVHLDTTMACTPFTEALMPMPPDLRPRLAELRERIVLGSDFPNIPHPYAVQLESLERLDLGDDWLRAVCWDNGARLLLAGAR